MVADDGQEPATELSDELLEALALGHLSVERARELRGAVAAGREAGTRFAQIQEVAGTIRAALCLTAQDQRAGKTIGDERLALYLCDALDAADREALEKDLCASPAALGRLAALYRESRAVMESQAGLELPENRPAGEALDFEAEGRRNQKAQRRIQEQRGRVPGAGRPKLRKRR